MNSLLSFNRRFVYFVLAAVIFSAVSCNTDSSKNKPVSTGAPLSQGNSSNSPSRRIEKIDISSSIGVVVLAEGYSEDDDMIELLNNDGTVWHRFSYYYDDKDGVYEYEKKEFKPFAFHPDYFLLGLLCLKETDKYFDVVVDSNSGLKKRILKSKKTTLKSWEGYVSNAFSVDFDLKLNPIRKSPDGDIVPNATFDLETTVVSPQEIKGNWMKVKAEEEDSETPIVGWIRWRDEKHLLVELFHFA